MPLATLMTQMPRCFLPQKVTLRAHGWVTAVALELSHSGLHSVTKYTQSGQPGLKTPFSGPLRKLWEPAHCPQGRSLQIHPWTSCALSSPLQISQLLEVHPHTLLNSHPGSQLTSTPARSPAFHILGTSHISHPTFPLWECPLQHGLTDTSAPSQVPRAHPYGGALSLCLLFTVPPHEPLFLLMTDEGRSRAVTEAALAVGFLFSSDMRGKCGSGCLGD